jgi:hypothetical protein
MPARPVPKRHWRSYGDEPLPSGAEALDEPLRAFPSWFLRIVCGRCGKERMIAGFRGLTSTSRPKEITIAQNTFDDGLRAVAATIVHELAHVNGAPGKPNRMAEDTLRSCGFSDQFDEAAVGVNVAFPPPPALYRPHENLRLER